MGSVEKVPNFEHLISSQVWTSNFERTRQAGTNNEERAHALYGREGREDHVADRWAPVGRRRTTDRWASRAVPNPPTHHWVRIRILWEGSVWPLPSSGLLPRGIVRQRSRLTPLDRWRFLLTCIPFFLFLPSGPFTSDILWRQTSNKEVELLVLDWTGCAFSHLLLE
jgi:hypothetical protein